MLITNNWPHSSRNSVQWSTNLLCRQLKTECFQYRRVIRAGRARQRCSRRTQKSASAARQHSLIIIAATWRNSWARPSKGRTRIMYRVEEMKGSHGRAATHLIICRETHNIISPRIPALRLRLRAFIIFLEWGARLVSLQERVAAMGRPGLTLMSVRGCRSRGLIVTY